MDDIYRIKQEDYRLADRNIHLVGDRNLLARINRVRISELEPPLVAYHIYL